MYVLKFITNITHLLMCIAGLVLAIYGFSKQQKQGYMKMFNLIALLSFIDTLSLIVFYLIFKSENIFNVFSDYFQILYLSTELITIAFFYLNIIRKTSNKHFFKSISISAFILVSINYFFDLNVFEEYYSLFVIIEVIIINACFGFILINSFDNEKPFISNPQIEINKGLFIFINITAPYYLVNDYLELHKTILTTYTKFINDIGYIILFIQIYKAYRWSPQK